jgi:uncharacterized protein
VEDFLRQLTASLSQAPERIEFWGGEPLVYIKTLKPLAERLRMLYSCPARLDRSRSGALGGGSELLVFGPRV